MRDPLWHSRQYKAHWYTNGTIDKIILLLAKGLTKREIGPKAHVDRSDIGRIFNKRIKVTYDYAKKVCDDVIKRKLSFGRVVSKYGNRGLQALNDYNRLIAAAKRSAKVQQCLELRGDANSPARSLGQIGKLTGISHDTVLKYLQRGSGVYFHPNRLIAESRDRGQLILQLRKSGLTFQQIGKIVNQRPTSVRAALNRLGVHTAKYSLLTPDDIRTITELRKKQVAWQTIARIYNINLKTLETRYYSVAHLYNAPKLEEVK